MKTKHSPEFKAKIVIEVLKGERTLSEIASQHNLHPNLVTRWKTEAIKNMPQSFEGEGKAIRQQANAYVGRVEHPETKKLNICDG
jgi:transposase-like protein